MTTLNTEQRLAHAVAELEGRCEYGADFYEALQIVAVRHNVNARTLNAAFVESQDFFNDHLPQGANDAHPDQFHF